jgi:hypothetical protein
VAQGVGPELKKKKKKTHKAPHTHKKDNRKYSKPTLFIAFDHAQSKKKKEIPGIHYTAQ